jgi:putative transposase
MLKPLRRAHRRVSRRQLGSSNREKARHMLARLYERIHNRRRDFLHKLSTYYSNRYDLIFLERLKEVLNMTKNHRLARKILDASWSTFKQMLQYKANRVIVVVEVEPSYTSVDCSRCDNNPAPKSLAVRTYMHVCPECGAVLDRDCNASSLNNILQRGLKSPAATTGGTPGSYACRDRTATAVEEAGRSPQIYSWVSIRQIKLPLYVKKRIK